MAQKPDGSAAKTERVTFTRPAAERIAKVVRAAESGNRNSAGLSFGRGSGADASKVFRICTFTGSWSVGSSKQVSLKHQATTPNTVTAINLFFPVTSNAATDCAIAKDGTAWFLIDVPLFTASVVFVTSVSVAATLNTNTCAITVATTAATATATFLRI